MNPTLFLALLALWPAAPTALGGGADLLQDDMTELSLEQLMDIEVSVASRSQQKLSDAPAAVYVLTNDEIRRSGAQSIQEALRMVPGFLVGHWQSTTWDATSRGFTSAFNHNILVMIDGVNIYTLMGTEGVMWHLVDIDLADVERIEVVRGPGAALWGNNAVNGVINVVTKHARDTQGWSANGVVGGELNRGVLRYGGELGEGDYFRVWTIGADHDGLADTSGQEIHNNNWWSGRAGFRGDWQLEGGGSLSLITNVYDARRQQNYRIDFQFPPYAEFVSAATPELGASAVAALELPHANGDVDRIVTSFQHATMEREDFATRTSILDVDWQRRSALGARQTLTYGLGWRFVGWHYNGDFSYNHKPEQSTAWTVRGFALDEIEFPDQHARLLLGAELEQNSFTGTEFQPTARGIWEPAERHTLWTAVSRAVRVPSLVENFDWSQLVNTAPDDVYVWMGNDQLKSEEVLAFELGWRWRANEHVSFDSVAFYNDLDHVVTSEDGTPFTQGGVNYTPFTYANLGAAEAWGFELGVDVRLSEDWSMRGALTHFEQNNTLDPASTDPYFIENSDLMPENVANLRSYYNLGGDWELDLALFYVDQIRDYGTPSYVRTDARLGYSPSPDWRFSLGLQNATDPLHPEDGGSEVERNLWFGFAWSH